MSAQTCQGLVVRVGDGGSPKLNKESVPVPKPGPRELLVRVSCVAQNPTDIHSFDLNIFGDGAILGCDFVGTVEELGSEVSRIAKGDVVAGLIWGGEIKGIGGTVPARISPEQASTVPLAATTAWLALFSKDCLNIDRSHGSNQDVLIWGGSSSVGLYTIQIAALYGFNIITTCSPRNFDLVRSYGAKHVFDYRDQKVVENIKEAAPDLKYVFDTIGNSTSSTDSRSSNPWKRKCIVTDVFVWSAFLKDHSYGKLHWPPNQEGHELSRELFEKLPSLLESGKIKPNIPNILDGGLDAVSSGFQKYRDGKISAYKIVYKL